MAVMATAHPIDILIRLLGEGRFDYSDESGALTGMASEGW